MTILTLANTVGRRVRRDDDVTGYAVIIERSMTGYGAYAPELPGVGVTASTIDEVERLISEAIVLHVDSLREHGEPVPTPSCGHRDHGEPFRAHHHHLPGELVDQLGRRCEIECPSPLLLIEETSLFQAQKI